jgi:membrane-bound serine protease (ClpP class)
MSVNQIARGTVLKVAGTCLLAVSLFVCASCAASGQEVEKTDGTKEKSDRVGYIIKVPLPIVGNRDADVSRQIRQLSEAVRDGNLERPIVVLQFQASVFENGTEPGTSRGSQFERCLALARSITDRESSNLRIVAYLPESVEGHAVLPILACQEIYANPRVELGRAAIDSESDATVRAAYQDITSRGRTNIPAAAVEAMLTPNLELFRISTVDSPTQVATREQIEKLKKDGQLLQQEGAIWNKFGLAAFSAKEMREWLWIGPEVQNPMELAKALGLEGGLRTVQQLPREWKAATVRIADSLDREKTNQVIRSIQEATTDKGVNLLIFLFNATECEFDEATRLANAIGELRENVYTVAYVQESLTGPIGLAAVSCGETVLIGDSTLGPDLDSAQIVAEGNAEQRVLGHIASFSQRPLPLLSVIVDKEAEAVVYTHQKTGKRELMTEGQVSRNAERAEWFPNAKVAGRAEIPQEAALQYGLVNAVEKSTTAGLSRLGIEQLPDEVSSPWLDSVIQMFGLMALMIELGNPGIGVGGLAAGLCFLGFFWIEGLNGNVEWLEILLFLGGLLALAIELFLLPGFGVFGITGLLMVFLSLVLAGQTFVWPGTSAEVTTLASNLFWVAFLGFSGMVGLLFMHQRLEKLPMFRWLSLSPGGTDELEQLEQRESIVSYDYLLGQLGTTKTRLNPSGKAQFADDIISVVGSGGLIDEGVPVQVVEVRGNLVIVEECT